MSIRTIIIAVTLAVAMAGGALYVNTANAPARSTQAGAKTTLPGKVVTAPRTPKTSAAENDAIGKIKIQP